MSTLPEIYKSICNRDFEELAKALRPMSEELDGAFDRLESSQRTDEDYRRLFQTTRTIRGTHKKVCDEALMKFVNKNHLEEARRIYKEGTDG